MVLGWFLDDFRVVLGWFCDGFVMVLGFTNRNQTPCFNLKGVMVQGPPEGARCTLRNAGTTLRKTKNAGITPKKTHALLS